MRAFSTLPFALIAILAVFGSASDLAAETSAEPPPAAPAPASPNEVAQDRASTIELVAGLAPELLTEYIRRDTTNPPGNEISGVRYLVELLEKEGLAPQVFESEPGRASLALRLKGNGKKRPIVLLSHVDVVTADVDQWDHPPFDGGVHDGVLYGRGALDCKGPGIIQLLSLVALKRLGVELDRDIILLATAGEETGGSVGAGWLLENHPELVTDAEFVLNEGGGIIRSGDKPLLFNLGAAEKGPCWFEVRASGDPGHGSRPARETSVSRLVSALDALLSWKRPYRVGPVVAGYFAAYAEVEAAHARQLRQLDRALEDEEFHAWFTSDPGRSARVYDTLTPTVLTAAPKTNIIPSEAVAEVDARLLPGTSCEDFLSEVRERVGSKHVRIAPLAVAFPSSQSPLDSDLVRAVEKLAEEEGESALVLPALLAGFTDSHYFRELGIAAYGFVPLVIDAEEGRTMHAPNERVKVRELIAGVKRMVRLLELISE